MARLTIYKDNYTDSTVISNCFIDEFMAEANDAQLKVYLYLIRMLNANQATSVSDIADKFNHTEKDVLRALKYWEQKQLLALDYDEYHNLVGINLRDLNQPGSSIPVSASAPILSLSTIQRTQTAPAFSQEPALFPVQNPPLRQTAPAAPVFSVSGCPAADGTEYGDSTEYAKPAFSADQLREFKNREDTAQLLFITESYLGKPLTPNEMKSILFFSDVLHFSDDLIDYLIQYCIDRGKKDFKYIEKVAINWAQAGITTPKEAEQLSSRYDKNVYTIMNMLGKNTSPTPREVEYINRWTKEYGFSNDIILEACERTVMATDKHRFEYADSILSSWKRQDVHRKADIHKIDDLYQQKRRAAANKAASVNKFNQFTQNDYDFDELERELLSN